MEAASKRGPHVAILGTKWALNTSKLINPSGLDPASDVPKRHHKDNPVSYLAPAPRLSMRNNSLFGNKRIFWCNNNGIFLVERRRWPRDFKSRFQVFVFRAPQFSIWSAVENNHLDRVIEMIEKRGESVESRDLVGTFGIVVRSFPWLSAAS